MKKIKNILLIVAMFLSTTSFYNNENQIIDYKNDDTNLLCYKWMLVKIVSPSEGIEYKSESKVVLFLNCKSNVWSMKEDGENVGSGTWTFKNSVLELNAQEESQKYIVKHLDKKSLTLSHSNILQEFTRK